MRKRALVSGLAFVGLLPWIGCGQGVVTLYTGAVGTGTASSTSGAGGMGGHGSGGAGGHGSGGTTSSGGASSSSTGEASSSSSAAASSSSNATSSSSSAAASSSSNAAASSSSGAMMVCTPGSMQSCYTGPAGTQGLGICKAGTQTCLPNGSAFGPCQGEVLPLPFEDCSTPMDDNCNGMVNEGCAPGSAVWAQDDGTSGGDAGFAIAVDPAGDVVVGGLVAGAFSGVAVFAGSALVRKRTGGGAPVWSRAFSAGNGNGQYAVTRGIAADAMGHVIAVGEFVGTIDFGGGPFTAAGGTAPDAFVVALDAAGNHLWSHAWGDSQAQASNAVATDAAGDVFVTGSMAGTVDFGGGPLAGAGATDAFLVKLSASGQHLWSKRYGDATPQNGTGVATTTAGDVVLLGEFSGAVDLGGVTLTAMGQSPNSDLFLAKLSGAGGAAIWAKRFGDAQSQQGYGVAVDPLGNVAVAGQIRGSIDFGGGPLTNVDPTNATTDAYVAKLDAGGGYLWAQRFGDVAIQAATGVAMDAAGDVAIVGLFKGSVGFGGATFTDPSAGTFDAFVAKLASANGAHLWSHQVGDASDQRGRGIAMDAAGDVFITGAYQGTIALGPAATITSTSGNDVFTVKLAP